jgi:hypothetical protein
VRTESCWGKAVVSLARVDPEASPCPCKLASSESSSLLDRTFLSVFKDDDTPVPQ